ncbi:NAD(P)/FAD-dependent oxidoreductase [Streptococcus hongkongensis]|nr:NADH peroxidase [Streptococcus uberis]
MKDKKKKIVIIGASFAGLACAKQLSKLKPDNQLIIIDRQEYSNYIPNGLNFIYRQQIDDLSQAQWQDATLRLSENSCFIQAEVQTIDPDTKTLKLMDNLGNTFEESYEILVCAMGAKAESENIKGSNSEGVVTTKYFKESQQALEKIEKSRSIVVVGAGVIGLDISFSLSLQGKSVTLVEAAETINSHQSDPDMLEPLLQEMAKTSVKLLTKTHINEIKECREGLCLITDEGTQIRCDTVVLAVNFRPNSRLLQDIVDCSLDKTIKVNSVMQTSQKDIYAIGDLVALDSAVLGVPYYSPLINQAIKTGQLLAYHLAGFDTPKLVTAKVVGSYYFNYYHATLGLTQEEGSLYDNLVAIRYQAKSDREDRSPIWIKLIANQEKGQLVGAQLLSKENNLLLANQLAQSIGLKQTDCDLAFQDFLFTKGHSDLAYHLHQAALALYEKRKRL